MKIHSLIIDNFRAIEHLELTDLPEAGVILIHGDNEAGKSTILDALDAALNVRHGSNTEKLRALKPVGRDVAPEVALSATVGPYTFTIHKVFLRGKKSELVISAPRREQFTGREADEKLEAILAEHLDETLKEALFVRQGEGDPGIAAAGIPSITRALDEEVDGENGAAGVVGTDDTELMARVEEEYKRYFDKKGKEKASYHGLRTAVDGARERAEGLHAEVERLSGFVDEVARREADIAAIDAELPEAVEAERARSDEAAAARALAEKADAAAQAAARAGEDLRRAEDDLEARAEARERSTTLQEQSAGLGEQLRDAREAAVEEERRVAELAARRDTAKQALASARKQAEDAEGARQRVRARARVTELRGIVGKLDAADAEIAELRSRQPATPITDKDVRALEKAREELSLQRRLAEHAEARLEVTGPPHQRLAVDGEGRDFTGSATVGLRHGTTVVLGDFEVTYRAGQGGADAGAALEAAREHYEGLLATLGCEDVEEARRRRDADSESASQLEAVLRRRADVLGTRDADEIRAELARLVEQDAGGAAEPDDELTEDEAEAALRRAQGAVTDRSAELEKAEAELAPWAERTKAVELARLEATAESKEAEAKAASRALEEAEGKAPFAALEQARDQAREAAQKAQERASELAAEIAKADPQLAEDLAKGEAARVANLRDRRGEAERRVAELTGRIEQAAGVAEQADRADAALDAAEMELASTQRRAEAVKLLRETMLKHRDAARARYAEPFARALGRYASRVFGSGVEFTLGEGLQVTARTLDGDTVGLGELSGGAKEQLALLVRFAIAELAGAGGDGEVPVIVDDALGASDPARLERMNALFTQVGRESQVFVLTCYPRRFDRVQVAKRASISELTTTRP